MNLQAIGHFMAFVSHTSPIRKRQVRNPEIQQILRANRRFSSVAVAPKQALDLSFIKLSSDRMSRGTSCPFLGGHPIILNIGYDSRKIIQSDNRNFFDLTLH